MPQDEQQPLFKDLAEGLPDDQKVEFYRTLHEAGISPEDKELARLLRALQLYKAYYESIPSAVQGAAGRIEQLKKDIERFSAEARGNLDLSTHLAGQVIQETERIHQDFTQIHKHIEEAMRQSAENLASKMATQLEVGIEQRIIYPLQIRLEKLTGSSKAFDDAIVRNNKAAAALEKSTTMARRLQIRTYSVCGLLVLLTLALFTAFFMNRCYANRFDAERKAIVKQTEQNRTVLLQLSKSRRTLELLPSPERPKRKLLVMKNASGWQSAGKQGVIEFDE
jgi:type VI protein secretion system component VasK